MAPRTAPEAAPRGVPGDAQPVATTSSPVQPPRAAFTVDARARRTWSRVSPQRAVHFELALHALWLFPLDEAPSAVAGDAEIAVRWSQRFGVGFHAGVARPWQSFDHSGDSAASVDVRRIPCAVLIEVGLRLHRGSIRLGGGPLVEVWRVTSSGVSQPNTRYVARPGLEVRAAYHYDVARWFFEAGLQLDVGLLRHDFVVTGPGTLSHTPLADLAPFLGVGTTF